MASILIVEDDAKIAALLEHYLKKYDLDAYIADDFGRIAAIFDEQKPKLVLMDINLPKFDGYYWCRKIRMISLCPIIFLSARDSEIDQVMALENGADDYMTKPFYYQVVIAKVRAQLRRVYGEFSQDAKEPKYSSGSLIFFPHRFIIEQDGHEVELTKNEAKLLEAIWRAAPEIADRDLLLEEIWDEAKFIDDNTLSVNVARLRRKLAELNVTHAIQSIRGKGYRWIYGGDHA